MMVRAIHPGGNKELAGTVCDIRSMAYRGKYYACKIHGAADLAVYRSTKNAAAQTGAVTQLTRALEYWKMYIGSAMEQYKNPL